jgi:hypothetical protein
MAQRGRKSVAALALVQPEPLTVRPHPEFDPPPPPSHLGPIEKAIWRDVFVDYTLTTRIAASVLTSALEAHARCRECRQVIDSEGLIVGRDKPHPLLRVERDSRLAWLAALKALGLEL